MGWVVSRQEQAVVIEESNSSGELQKVSKSAKGGKDNMKGTFSTNGGGAVDLFAGKTALQLVAHKKSARLMKENWWLRFQSDLYHE